MNRCDADALLASLGGDQVVFRYFEDRYALQLLAYAASVGSGPFGRLIRKPSIRRLLGARGGRGVDWALLDAHYPRGTQAYELTFASWGDGSDDPWFQTTRPGFNLVVQLNFPPAHERAYRRHVAPRSEDPFVREWHPVRTGGPLTMSWARIDLDLDRGEGLIEEIQSDWIRDAEAAGAWALAALVDGALDPPEWIGDAGCDAVSLFRYVEYVLAPHRRIWAEATLGACLWLLRERLGIRRIWFHTHEDGAALKRIGRRPPRSIYEALPRSFCFERAGGWPPFLARTAVARRVSPRPEFWRLML